MYTGVHCKLFQFQLYVPPLLQIFLPGNQVLVREITVALYANLCIVSSMAFSILSDTGLSVTGIAASADI